MYPPSQLPLNILQISANQRTTGHLGTVFWIWRTKYLKSELFRTPSFLWITYCPALLVLFLRHFSFFKYSIYMVHIMERLDVNSALLHISLLMEHRGGGEVWQKNGRWRKNINCYFDKFCAWYWFPIPMSQIYQTSQKHQNIKEETSPMKKFSFYYQRPKAIKRTMKKLFIWSQAKIQYFQLKERPRQKCFFRKCAFLLPHRIWDFVTLAKAVVGAKRCQREPKSFSHKFASSWTFPIFPTGLPFPSPAFPFPVELFPPAFPPPS